MTRSSPESTWRPSHATTLVFGLTLLAIACSLFFNGNHYYAYEISVTAAMLALAISFGTLLRPTLALGLAGSVFGLFVGWSALAIAWSSVPYVSVLELGSVGAGLLLYLTLALQPNQRLILATRDFLASLGFALSAAMLLQATFGFEPRAMFLNPNSAAGYINLLWPISATAWLVSDRSNYRRTVALCAVAIMFAAIGLTGSRGAIIAALVGLTIIAATGMLLLRQYRRVGILIVLVLAALTVANTIAGGQLGASVGSMADPNTAGASRFRIWSAAWEMILEKPWLGYGPGVFFLAYRAFRHPSDGSAGYFVHNDYLQFWLERGIPGLVLIVLLTIACIALFRQSWINERLKFIPAPGFPITLSAAAGLSTLFVHGLFSYSMQMMPFLVVLGLMLAQLESGSTPLRRMPLPVIRGRPLRAIALGGLFIVGAWQIASHALYFNQIDAGTENELRARYAEAADEFSRARALWSLPDAAWYLQANVHYQALRADSGLNRTTRQYLASQALEFLDAAERRNPLQPATPLIRGLFHANLPELAPGSAKTEFRNALRLDPRTVGARYALSQLLEREGRPEEAIRLTEEGLRLRYQNRAHSRVLATRLEELRGPTGTEAPRDAVGEPEIDSRSYEPAFP